MTLGIDGEFDHGFDFGDIGRGGFSEFYGKFVDGHHAWFVFVVDFVNAIAEDVEDIAWCDGGFFCLEGDAVDASDDHAWGVKLLGSVVGVLAGDEDGRGVTAGCVGEFSGRFFIDAVPCGEVHLVLFFHVEGIVHT